MMIEQALSGVKLGAPQSFRNLTVFPLIGADDPVGSYLLLDDALHEKSALVSEVSQAGSVPTLAFDNKSETPVLLVEGEELRGAKQNRILNLTIFVGGGVKIDIPVSCVEQGRWNYNSSHFHTEKGSERMAFSKARTSNYANVTHSLMASNSAAGNQSDVWAKVGEKLRSTHTVSGSSSMSDAYDKMAKDITPYEKAFEAVANQRGAVVCVDGVPVGMEMFDAEASFKKFMAKLIRSYALDAVETGKDGHGFAVDEELVRAFLTRVGSAKTSKFETVGLGESLRWTEGKIAGGARVVNRKVVHMASFVS